MLVLSRKQNESIKIGGSVTVTVVGIRGNKVRLGVDAPRDITIDRQEVAERKAKEVTRSDTTSMTTRPEGAVQK